MTDHSFDLAAALIDKATERLASGDYGLTRILVHEFGPFPLCANHTRHDTGHTVKMWAYDDDGLMAAAEATAPHAGGNPQARIVNFRAAHLTFGALDADTAGEISFARGARAYILTAATGSSEWTVQIGDDATALLFPALHDITGGVEDIVTERDLRARREAAQRADIDALTEARAQAGDLDNQLARAEAAAARAFAAGPARDYDLAAELPALRAEIDLLAAAGARSPAAMYRVPDQAIAALDEDSRGAVIAIANSAQAIQPLQLHDGADKPAVLAALAAAAHHHQRRILALPATEQASAHATTNHYADTTTSPVTGRDNLEHGRWTLPLGSLVIVDDADHLNRDQLRYLTDNAARTNTKLLLLIARDPGREPAHSLTAVLTANLPWVQHLGTPDPAAQPPRTAVARAEHHLALTTTVSGEHTEVTHLLNRRKQLIDLYRDLTTDRDQTRDRDQRRARDYGLEL